MIAVDSAITTCTRHGTGNSWHFIRKCPLLPNNDIETSR